MKCLTESTDCSKGPHGPIGSWDIYAVTDMRDLFVEVKEHANKDANRNPIPGADKFNGDLSKWDVLDVIRMGGMFIFAKSFNADLSKWDVSSVTNMQDMFSGASSFTQSLCDKWQTSQADKKGMFTDSRWKGCLTNTGGKTTSKKALNATNPYPDCDPRS